MEIENQNRRKFIKLSSLLSVMSVSPIPLSIPNLIDKRSIDDTIRIGLVGCGGRGTGAVNDALNIDSNLELHSVGDIFRDRIDSSLYNLKELHGDKIKVKEENKFIGLNSFQKVINSDIDVVFLATPPVFRPLHLTASIQANKHVFYEKPVAIDSPGVRKVIEIAKLAQEKNLSLLCGFVYRYDFAKQALIKKIHEDEIGEIKAISATRFGGHWHEPVMNNEWTDLEYKLRFWYYYNWLSGDFNVEQFVHSLDMISWSLNEMTPIRAYGSGGRQERVETKYGNIYDHFSTTFEFNDEIKVFTTTRQQRGTYRKNSVEFFGNSGNAIYDGQLHAIKGHRNWKYDEESNIRGQEEHKVLFDSIRRNKGINDLERSANSTMMGILSRMASYSGQVVEWDDAIKSNLMLGPAPEDLDLTSNYSNIEIPVPGSYKLDF